jgi:hypothetical protein
MIKLGFDVISDLNLDPNDSFNWEGKPTSLYCLLTGNISSDLRTVHQTLLHLGKLYQGVFYTPGLAEYSDTENINQRTAEIVNMTQSIPNVVLLHHNVIIVDGVAVIGSNCWENAHEPGRSISIDELKYYQYRMDDMGFLHQTIEKLQRHVDVKRIIIVTNAVPNENCYFGQTPDYTPMQIPLDTILNADTESKVSHWVYGSYGKPVEATLLVPRKNDLTAITNPLLEKNVKNFHAKRLEIAL